jgi:acyl-coenzyme A synthetase/AMP-(fatty) acid ligase
VNPDVVIRWKEMTGVEVLDGYGQTETLMTIANTVGRSIKPGSMGQPLSGIEIAVLTSAGAIGGVGAAGQLLIKTPNPQLMLGYYGDEERTAACFAQVDGVTWFQTGDNVEIDDDGYVFYVGRTDDIINSSGYRIGPQEVENVLAAHPAVRECAVVGYPDKERGEIVVAFIVLAPGVEVAPDLTKDLQQYVKQLTAPYKYPRRIEFVADLPKTVSGKLRRNVLRSFLTEME